MSVDACVGNRTAVPRSLAPSLLTVVTEFSRLYARCDVFKCHQLLPAAVVLEMLQN